MLQNGLVGWGAPGTPPSPVRRWGAEVRPTLRSSATSRVERMMRHAFVILACSFPIIGCAVSEPWHQPYGPTPPHIDLTVSPPSFDARVAELRDGWTRSLDTYWLRHRYYPSQALQAGVGGQVKIELTVNRLGKVEDVTLLASSGSQWLDLAALASWRSAQLAAFPAKVTDHRITLAVAVTYTILPDKPAP